MKSLQARRHPIPNTDTGNPRATGAKAFVHTQRQVKGRRHWATAWPEFFTWGNMTEALGLPVPVFGIGCRLVCKGAATPSHQLWVWGVLSAPPAGIGAEPRPPKGFPLFSALRMASPNTIILLTVDYWRQDPRAPPPPLRTSLSVTFTDELPSQ